MFLQNTFLMPCLRVPMPYTDDRNQFILKQKMLSDFNTYLNMFNMFNYMWHAKLAFYIYKYFLTPCFTQLLSLLDKVKLIVCELSCPGKVAWGKQNWKVTDILTVLVVWIKNQFGWCCFPPSWHLSPLLHLTFPWLNVVDRHRFVSHGSGRDWR